MSINLSRNLTKALGRFYKIKFRLYIQKRSKWLGDPLKNNIKKIALCFMGALCFQAPAYAVDIDVGATLHTSAAISATKGQDMNFGTVRYDANHAGQVQLGTNGSLQLSGDSYGLALSGGTATPGDIIVGGDSLSNVEVSCEVDAQLGNNGSSTLSLSNVQFSVNAGHAYGAATMCNGLGNASATLDLGAEPAPQLFFGAAVNFTSNSITSSETFSTSNGGDPVTVRIVYQ